tara:strand:+ start:2948 stop:3064 length:117 start_codon:yes stop_codon:yes gene_type:complete
MIKFTFFLVLVIITVYMGESKNLDDPVCMTKEKFFKNQ